MLSIIAVTLCQVHVVAAVNSVCLGAATTLTQTLRSTLSSTKESLYEAWIVIAIALHQRPLSATVFMLVVSGAIATGRETSIRNITEMLVSPSQLQPHFRSLIMAGAVLNPRPQAV